MPPGWQPSADERQFAAKLGLDPERILAEFRDYWAGVPGRQGTKLDWPATWRNRCRDIAKKAPRNGHVTPLFDVADPCSGLRSLLAMTALTAVYAYFTQKTALKKWILFAASVPLAVVGNIARIVTVAVVAEAAGGKLALGIYHDYSGYILFTASITMMVVIGGLLNLEFSEVIKKCKSALLRRI